MPSFLVVCLCLQPLEDNVQECPNGSLMFWRDETVLARGVLLQD